MFYIKVSIVFVTTLLVVFQSLTPTYSQLTFYPKSRWDKSQFVHTQNGEKLQSGSSNTNDFQWNHINDLLKQQIQSNPIKVIQTLIGLGMERGPLSLEELSSPNDNQGKKVSLRNDRQGPKLLKKFDQQIEIPNEYFLQ